MKDSGIKRALISVYDKTGIVDFARALVDEFAIEIISTGGTAKLLTENDIPVTLVNEVTDFPEMMDGRVKTLHPKIHAGILANRDNPEHMRQLEEQGIKPIDMVVVNLYPFEKTVSDPNCSFEQAIEMIDIGGPCMLRAAAKNHKHVWPVCTAEALGKLLEVLRAPEGDREEVAEQTRSSLARQCFEATTRYDAAISGWLGSTSSRSVVSILRSLAKTRYGENPHQQGELFATSDKPQSSSLIAAKDRSADLSYNNYVDAHAALELCKELTRELSSTRTCVFIKHTNACGVGIADDPIDAYRQAYLGDPNAAMGGILACNFDVDADFARAVMATYQSWGKDAGAGGFFVEVWIAPSFHDDALEVIKTTKKWGERVRLLGVGDMSEVPDQSGLEYKSVYGGMMAQSPDLVGLNEEQWKVVTKRKPSDAEMNDLRLAWLVCKHTKSNAITICKDNMLIGNGAGQMSRVMSCRIATWLAKENNHEGQLSGSVAASDAFFPFPDGPEILIDSGVTAIIQPGGSKRDEDTIQACDQRDVAMVVTGTRHFRH